MARKTANERWMEEAAPEEEREPSEFFGTPMYLETMLLIIFLVVLIVALTGLML